MSDSREASAKRREEADERDISALMSRIQEHDAARAHADWESLGRVVQAFLANGHELTILISAPDNEPELLLTIFAQGSAVERESYFDELYRRLHNFLAILATLTDNARALAKKYQRTDFEFEYQNRVSKLALLPVAAFLKDFRNYLVHYQIAPLSMHLSLQRAETGSQTPSFSITLDAQRLLAWDGWKKDSRSFLRAREVVVLIDCVTEYTEQIMELYGWMLPHYELLHAREITEFHALQGRLRGLLGIEAAPPTAVQYAAPEEGLAPEQ